MAFPLLKLPREIRDSIYHDALIIPPPMRRHYLGSQGSHAKDKPKVAPEVGWWSRRNGRLYCRKEFGTPSPALLLANKQVYQEASEVLYTSICVVADDSNGLKLFLDQIGPVNAAYIRHLELHCGRYRREMNNVLRACTGLSTLRLHAIYPNIHPATDYECMLPRALDDMRSVQHDFLEGTDIRTTLVVTGMRGGSFRKDLAAIMFEAPRNYGWRIRRETLVAGRYPDGKWLLDQNKNEAFLVIEEPFDMKSTTDEV